MKMLVTGGAGMLGSSLVPALVGAGHELTVTDIDLSNPAPWGPQMPVIGELDVRDRYAVADAFDQVNPDAVVHLAAETSLEFSDDNPDHAYLTNTIATKYVTLQCKKHDVPLTYISTAGVFDGEKPSEVYTEYDQPNPLNVYGDSKYRGEIVVRDFLDKFYIIRAGWMVGGGRTKDHKFVARMLNQIRDGKKTLHAVGDKLGTPTYTPDFARTYLNLIESEQYGLYHMACEGKGSRYDVAQRILEVLGLQSDIELIEVTSDFFAEQFPSVRPYSEIMRNMNLDLQGMNLMRPWQVALEEYLTVNFAELMATEKATA
ncbi:MAG: dTDP-4-dehydrorhamnose reductase [Acidimicrobiales bacterium]|nr:MAG: SDR family oxidoreductase [Actinomycetota bacterium]MBV6509584.1 dTDP-4-dehydrorhamnose reductase [Acidimicrobiales bacterium]RIK06554.1 MAG: NAD(P)-dependent oxidoreductase [Acidobacteriota bacterium]